MEDNGNNTNVSGEVQTIASNNGSEQPAPTSGKEEPVKTPQEQNTGDSPTQEPEKSGAPKDKQDTKDTPVEQDKGTQEDKQEDTNEEVDTDEDGWPDFSDNPHMSAITSIFKDKGVAVDVADGIFSKAIESGNIEDVDVETLESTVGKDAATLIMASVNSVYTENVAHNKAIIKTAHEEFGNKDAWDAAAQWAITKANEDTEFKETLEDYYKMIDSGSKRQAELAIKALKEDYMNDPNTTDKPDLVRGDGTGKSNVKPITDRMEYVSKLKEAYNKGDADRIADLRRRRAAGRASDSRFSNGSW